MIFIADVLRDAVIAPILSPPQPVDERDIKSSARTVWNLTYTTLQGARHEMTFRSEVEATEALMTLVNSLRGIPDDEHLRGW